MSIGNSYITETAARSFTHYIAETKRSQLVSILQEVKYFSLLLNGSTDAVNVDNELLLAVWFDKDGHSKRVCTRTSYLKISKLSAASALGLFGVLKEALQGLGIREINKEECTKLVGIGTDGASANVANAGLKGLVEKELPWVFWMWCLAHRLELAIKDALKQTSFDLIDDMLLRLYLLYENSPKRCRQLEEIMIDLRELLSIEDSGVKPVRASGSKWITHK